MRRNKYETPRVEIIEFLTEDVISISNDPSVPSSSEPEQPVLPWD